MKSHTTVTRKNSFPFRRRPPGEGGKARLAASFFLKGPGDLVELRVHDLRPTVLVHVVPEILVAGALFLLQPVVQVALDPVGRDGQAAALLQDHSVQLQPCEGVLEVLAQIGQVGALFLRVAVVLPQGCDDLPVRGLGAAVVDKDRNDLLGLGVLEDDRFPVDKQLDVAQDHSKEPH